MSESEREFYTWVLWAILVGAVLAPLELPCNDGRFYCWMRSLRRWWKKRRAR